MDIFQMSKASGGKQDGDWKLDACGDDWGHNASDSNSMLLIASLNCSTETHDLECVTLCEEADSDFPQIDSMLLLTQFNPPDSEGALCMDAIEPCDNWGMPCSIEEYLANKTKGIKNNVKPPDISSGLGRSKSKQDIVKLEEYVVQHKHFMVYNETLYVYKAPCWRKLEGDAAEAMIRMVLEEAGLGDFLIYQDYNKIRQNLLCNPRVRVENEIPTPADKLNLLDGTYDLNQNLYYPHNPEDYFFNYINVCYGDIRGCEGKTFEAFVEQISNGNPNVRRQLLELIALTILGKQAKYFYVLLGESNTGKTQFGRFLEELVGRENVESIRDVCDFSDRWTVGSLAGKLLATCLDLPDKPLPTAAIGIIKQFVGDDPVKGEQKHKNPFTFYHKPMLIFAGNHPIRIPNMDREQALLNRMVVIPFQNPVPENRMKQALYKELLKEGPYIVGQALIAYEDLIRNNFEVTRTALPAEFMPYEAHSGIRNVIEFLKQCCISEDDAETATDDLYKVYCMKAAGDKQLSQIDFSRILSKHLKTWDGVTAIKRVNGTERRGYRGIRIL